MKWLSRSTIRRLGLNRFNSVRARRHRLALAVRYRPAWHRNGSTTSPLGEWRPGKTRDISATGALLETESETLHIGDELELQLALPSAMVGRAHVPLVCRARVVRVETSSAGTMRLALALSDCNLLRDKPLPWNPQTVDVCHNVNNCLTAIVGASELLLLNEGDGLIRRQLALIRDSALRASVELQRLAKPAA